MAKCTIEREEVLDILKEYVLDTNPEIEGSISITNIAITANDEIEIEYSEDEDETEYSEDDEDDEDEGDEEEEDEE